MSQQPIKQHSTWFVVVVAVFITCLLIANIIAVMLLYIYLWTHHSGRSIGI